MTIYYHRTHQLGVSKAEAKITSDKDYKFQVMFLLSDKKGVGLTKPFELILKNHIRKFAAEFIYVLTGE